MKNYSNIRSTTFDAQNLPVRYHLVSISQTLPASQYFLDSGQNSIIKICSSDLLSSFVLSFAKRMELRLAFFYPNSDHISLTIYVGNPIGCAKTVFKRPQSLGWISVICFGKTTGCRLSYWEAVISSLSDYGRSVEIVGYADGFCFWEMVINLWKYASRFGILLMFLCFGGRLEFML